MVQGPDEYLNSCPFHLFLTQIFLILELTLFLMKPHFLHCQSSNHPKTVRDISIVRSAWHVDSKAKRSEEKAVELCRGGG